MRKPVDMTKFATTVAKKLNVSHGFNDPTQWVSTGNYLLDYLISGKFKDGGIPLGKVTMFAGESGSGKSLIASGKIIKNAQDMGVTPVIFDSENALDEEWLQKIGVKTDPQSILRFQVSMINDVAKIMNDFIEMYRKEYIDLPKEERKMFLFVVDSLGMLLSDTDIDQFSKGDMKGDMGRKPKQLNSLVRNIINQIGDLDIGVIFTNHTYASQDMFDPDDKVSGGNGIIYASSIVVATRKYKLKLDELGNKITDVSGVRTTAKIMKSRYGRPFETCNLHIRFDKGIMPYSGCLDYFEKVGVIQQSGNKLVYIDRAGNEHKEYRKNFGPEILQRIIDEWDYEKYRLISDQRDLENNDQEQDQEVSE